MVVQRRDGWCRGGVVGVGEGYVGERDVVVVR